MAAQDFYRLCDAGKEVKGLCEKLGLEIVMLQPFANFDILKDGKPNPSSERTRSDALKDGSELWKQWALICFRYGAGSLFTSVFTAANKVSCTKVGPTNSRSESRNVSSSHEVLEPHQLRLAYENLCGATYAPDWKQVWEIVQKVDRTDVGLCLDTFQTAGGE